MPIVKTPKDDLLMSLSHANLSDDEMFQEMVIQISTFLDIHEMASISGCTLSTIQRWVEGISAPHPVMRVGVINRLMKEIK